MKLVALIQARDNSTRCPNKATADLNGMPIIEHIRRRLCAVGRLDTVVVSTSLESANIIDLCQEKHWAYWAGSEEDLLARHLGAAMTYDADIVLRVTGDCPFHDPAILERAISVFLESKNADAMTSWHNGYRTFSEGLDFELVKVDAMRRLIQDRNCPREDWMTFLDRSTRYKTLGFAYPERVGHEIHLSVDTESDLKRARAMMSMIGNDDWRYSMTLKAWEMTK